MQLPSTGHLADARSPWKSLALKSGTRIVPGMTHGSSRRDLKSHQQGDNPECRDSHLSWVSGHIFSAHSFAGAAGILETKTVNWRRGPGSLKRMHVRILYTSSTRRREARITCNASSHNGPRVSEEMCVIQLGTHLPSLP